MNESDRLALARVLDQFERVREAVGAHAAARPHDVTLDDASVSLEATYQLRLYVVFESILTVRARGAGIASYVQWEVGETRTFDPAIPDARSPGIEWWRLLSRDRNALAHSASRPPALTIRPTLGLMMAYLSMRTERS